MYYFLVFFEQMRKKKFLSVISYSLGRIKIAVTVRYSADSKTNVNAVHYIAHYLCNYVFNKAVK